MKITINLKTVRESKNLTQKELADKAGFYFCNYEGRARYLQRNIFIIDVKDLQGIKHVSL